MTLSPVGRWPTLPVVLVAEVRERIIWSPELWAELILLSLNYFIPIFDVWVLPLTPHQEPADPIVTELPPHDTRVITDVSNVGASGEAPREDHQPTSLFHEVESRPEFAASVWGTSFIRNKRVP
ncbi:hypothetical protein AX15_005519 [Amanita polypyramis BW_CC]|nr:hypothetical protein AX15_005519 [Amanita polypyramis BW_CC]